jgi:hypothetical protein
MPYSSTLPFKGRGYKTIDSGLIHRFLRFFDAFRLRQVAENEDL